MAFEQHQLDEIRAALKISDVVGRRLKLRKQGREFIDTENKSFTVNDDKGFYHDFGTGEHGDIFDFLQKRDGYTFVGAVEELAREAGVTLEQRPGRSNGAGAAHEHQQRRGATESRGDRASGEGDRRAADPVDSDRGGDRQRDEGKNEVVAEWDYRDPENTLLYQVVRSQKRLTDGSWKLTKEGKPWKTFQHRRPDGEGSWIWAMDVRDPKTDEPQEFMRISSGWMRFDQEKFDKWRLHERRTFPDLPKLSPWLYNANEVIDELAEPREDQRTIYVPEGEAKVDVLREWGLLALTNSGGAQHFTPACAEFFRGARHVVLLQDNDRAGMERVAKLAPMLKAVDVEQVSVLNFRDVWTSCPVKGDVKDWRDQGGGTREALLEIVDALKPWVPTPYKSRYGAKTAADLVGATVRPYPWRIKGILPKVDNTLIMGPSRSGKTFEMLDICMHVHFGLPYAGRKTEAGGVVYLTYEGASGFENRLRAYLQHHKIKAEDLHSFAWLTRPPNLYASEDDAKGLGDEIAKIAERFMLPLAGIPIDTHNAATRGSSEIKSEDLNRIQMNYAHVSERTGAPLWIVGHTNAEGKHRGNETFFNGIEAALLVEPTYTDAKKLVEHRDDEGRVIRRVKVSKQREGDDHMEWKFVLQRVVIGIDMDGDEIPSMVSVEPAQHVPEEVRNESKRDRPEGYYLNANETNIFKALLKAMEEYGIAPPTALQLPASVPRVVRNLDFGKVFRRGVPRNENEPTDKYMNRTKSTLNRFREKLSNVGVVSVTSVMLPAEDWFEPVEQYFIWPTGKRVYGRGLQWPALPPAKRKKSGDAPVIDSVTGQEIDSIDGPPPNVF